MKVLSGINHRLPIENILKCLGTGHEASIDATAICRLISVIGSGLPVPHSEFSPEGS
jgi:hypothetical protein